MDALIEKQLRDVGIFSGALMNDHEYCAFLRRCGATEDAEMTGGFTVLVGATQDFVAGVKAQNRVARRISSFSSALIHSTTNGGTIKNRFEEAKS